MQIIYVCYLVIKAARGIHMYACMRRSPTQFTCFSFDYIGGATRVCFSSSMSFFVVVMIITAMKSLIFAILRFHLFSVHFLITYCRYMEQKSTPYKHKYCVLFK